MICAIPEEGIVNDQMQLAMYVFDNFSMNYALVGSNQMQILPENNQH